MRVIWSKVNKVTDSQVIYRARYGIVHMEHAYDLDGNHTYWLYTLASGRRNTLVRVYDNPKGPDQIDARARCEFIGSCLDNYLDFEKLPVELKEGSIVKLDKRPVPARTNTVDGLMINRVYRYEGSRGEAFYRVFSVMNTTAESWGNLVGYRNIFTGDDYGRPITEFTPEKYQLLGINTVIPNPHDFKIKTLRK